MPLLLIGNCVKYFFEVGCFAEDQHWNKFFIAMRRNYWCRYRTSFRKQTLFFESCYNKHLPISTYDQFRYKTTNIKSLNWTMIVKIANQRWGLVSPFVRITVITIPKEPFDDDPCIEDIQVLSKVLNEFQSNTSFMSSTICPSPDNWYQAEPDKNTMSRSNRCINSTCHGLLLAQVVQ